MTDTDFASPGSTTTGGAIAGERAEAELLADEVEVEGLSAVE